MNTLDAFKQDCIDNPNMTNGDSALQEEINNLSSNTDHIIDLNDVNNFFNLTKCECNEVKVGDKLKIYNRKTQTFDTVEVFSINKCYHPFTYEPVVAVTVNYDYDGVAEHDLHGLRKLSDPNLYYKLGSDEPIKEFTIKN